jgi:cell division inhibitor SepF
VNDSYSIPAPSASAKQQLDAIKKSSVKDKQGMESAMNNLFGKFGFSGQKGTESDFLSPPRTVIEEPVRSSLQVVNNTAPVSIVVVEPRNFEDSVEVVNHLKQRRSVIVNLQQLDQETSQRVLDFVSGATYAMDGTQERVGSGVFIFASINCRVESESEGTRAYKELFAKTFGV